MRNGELECAHGVGHSASVHGCDGCCFEIVREVKEQERERLIKLVHEETRHNGSTHYEGMNCFICHILRIMREEQ